MTAEREEAERLFRLAERDQQLNLPVTDEMLQRLTPYAVEFRYDDQSLPLINSEQARLLTENCLLWTAQLLESKQ